MVPAPAKNSEKTRAYSKKKLAAKCAGVAGSAKLRKNPSSIVGHWYLPGSDKSVPIIQKLTESELVKVKKDLGKEFVELSPQGEKVLKKSD